MTPVEPGKFHPQAAMKGYKLNRMCYSLNQAANREAFAADPDAYCARFGLNEEEVAAVKSRSKPALLAAGANMYFFPKLDRVGRPAGGQ